MVEKKLTGICAVAMLVVIAAACGCTSTTVESQPAGEPQEDMGAPRVNGAASEENPGKRRLIGACNAVR